ncbi:S-adenosyl-L-methionine-dependent methyltransferase [Umbelopsis sp. AD052]|nr:S-adenosyl-L-methionine-dependent methyltransferase [Umbelopsis sp. AD052]
MTLQPTILLSPPKKRKSYSHPERLLTAADNSITFRHSADFGTSLDQDNEANFKSVLPWTDSGLWTPPESRRNSSLIPPQQDKAAYDGSKIRKPLPPLPIEYNLEIQDAEPNFSNSKFRSVCGRQFLKNTDALYSLPIDEDEIDRMQSEHFMLKELLSGLLYHSPVTEMLNEGAYVLDLGCGCGSWCMEMATLFPRSTFVGCDIAPLYPTSIIPENCRFEHCDVTKRLPYNDNSFDFVISRNMALAVRFDSWQDYVDEMIRVSRPTAYIEIIELDWDVKNKGVNMSYWNLALLKLWRKRGVNPRVARLLRNYLCNISDLNVSYISMPIGDWGGQLGSCSWDMWKRLMNAAMPFYMSRTGLTKEEYGRLVNQCLEDSHVTHSHCNYWFYYGRPHKR